jgi:hypothetical protein
MSQTGAPLSRHLTAYASGTTQSLIQSPLVLDVVPKVFPAIGVQVLRQAIRAPALLQFIGTAVLLR